jgi:hypothetical protein
MSGACGSLIPFPPPFMLGEWYACCGEPPRCGEWCANCPVYEPAECGGEPGCPCGCRSGGERESESRPGELLCEDEEESESEGGTGDCEYADAAEECEFEYTETAIRQ